MTDQTGFLPQAAVRADAPALKLLWKTVFGDDDDDIERFFDVYFSPELTVVIKDGQTPVSAAYILPVGSLVLPNGGRENCAMLYAIATLPDCRGRGFGNAVTRASASLAVEKGFSAVVLKPADSQLFSYYEKRTDFTAFFETAEAEYLPDELPPNSTDCTLTPATAAAYRRMRQSILFDSVYIDTDVRALAYQQHLCRVSGGDMYIINSGGDDIGCAAVEPEDGTVHVKELLLAFSYPSEVAVRLLAGYHPAKRYIVRYPTNVCRSGPDKNHPFGMILSKKVLLDAAAVHCAKWYGPAFD